MKHLSKYFAVALSALFMASCQQPDFKVSEAEATKAINSITASFIDDTSEENHFKSEIDYDNHVITIVFPYTYPANTKYNLTKDDLKKVKVVANLDDNCFIEPSILIMDLTQDNIITVINQKKERTDYIVRGEIRKSNACAVTAFKLVDENLVGVVNESTKVISIIKDEAPAKQLAEVELSFGATITGTDPTKVACDYSKDVKFTVTAQDGKTTAEYTVKVQLPSTLEKGMRPGSGKILWNNKIVDTYAPATPLMMTSMAVIKDYIVLNTRNEDMMVVNRKTGAKEGTIKLPFKSSLGNFKATGDSSDNILVTNLDSKEIVVYRIKGINGTPTEYIRYNVGGKSYGRGISVIGSLDKDAVITMPRFGDAGWYFLRWTVTGGVLNTEPELVTINSSLNAGGWVYNCDVVATDPSNPKSDYFVNSYAKLTGGTTANVDRGTIWIDGATNKDKCHSPYTSSNWVRNALDYVKFNGVGYLIANSVNSFTWGADDMIYLYDLGDANLDNIVWKSEVGIYGSMSNINQANGNACSDVALRLSDNGYYMYAYFFFAGGQLVCVQFDCLDM